MFRSILGFALFAVVAFLALKLVLGLFGIVIGLAMTLLVWAAFRFSPREAVSAISILSGVMILGTVHGSGIFIQSSMNESLLLLQAFVIVATITTLMMAALVVEHRRTESDLRQAQGGLERKVERKTEELRQALDALKKDIIARERAEESLRNLSIKLMRVQDEERRKISRELHERIGQDIAALLFIHLELA